MKNIVTLLILCSLGFVSSQAEAKRKKKKKNTGSSMTATGKPQSIVADKDTYKQCKANALPSFINNSMLWAPDYKTHEYGSKKYGYGRTQFEAFRKLSPPSVLILAAGNGGDAPLNEHAANASRKYDAIIVGSLDPDGNKNSLSQQGAEVFITAPAGAEQISKDQNGNLRKFGGTSGAAPLVTSSLAGFEWLSGYHPTAEESKILLKKTAIPTPNSHDVPQLNGVAW